jgi:MFS family permease
MWVADKYGLRLPVGIGVVAMLVSSAARCFANDSSLVSQVLVHASFIINAAVGPIAMALPSQLAATWFAASERVTATAIASLGSQSGPVFLYLIVPFVCADDNSTLYPQARAEQWLLNVILTALAAVNVLLFGLYFPVRPLQPPSLSASTSATLQSSDRVSLVTLFRDSVKLLHCPPYIWLLVTYSITAGLASDAGALLTDNLGPLTHDRSATQSVDRHARPLFRLVCAYRD